MTNSGWTRRLKQAAWVGMLGLSIVATCGPGPARAQDDDDQNSIWNLNERVVKGFMGAIGLRDGSENSIDYRERSPLVVPPNTSLPAPDTTSAASNPAWPVDPDQKRRRETSTKKKSRKYLTGTNEDSRALSRSELDPPGVAAARGAGNVSTGGNDGNMTPSELGYFGGIFSKKALGFGQSGDEVGTFKQEPARSSLSEPPSGYQTPSPSEPYGVTKRIERKITPYDAAVGSTGKPN